eukprot:s4554_g17.t3
MVLSVSALAVRWAHFFCHGSFFSASSDSDNCVNSGSPFVLWEAATLLQQNLKSLRQRMREEPAQSSEEHSAEPRDCPASSSQPSKGNADEGEQLASVAELSTEASIKVDPTDIETLPLPREPEPSNDADAAPLDASFEPEGSERDAVLEDPQGATQAEEEEALGHDLLDQDQDQAHPAASDAPEGKNARSLEQQMSLRPTDDERTEISKKISWILRHGAKKSWHFVMAPDRASLLQLSNLQPHIVFHGRAAFPPRGCPLAAPEPTAGNAGGCWQSKTCFTIDYCPQQTCRLASSFLQNEFYQQRRPEPDQRRLSTVSTDSGHRPPLSPLSLTHSRAYTREHAGDRRPSHGVDVSSVLQRPSLVRKLRWSAEEHMTFEVNVNIDDNGWVNVTDLLHSDILSTTTEDKLLAMINESNVQKTRYEMEDDPNGGKRIRAISKSRRNAAQREMRERERREREKRREEDAREREARDRETREKERQDRDQNPRDPVREPVREHRRRDQPGWWDDHWQSQDGPTYEQQLKDGFLPVYQGSKLVAMAKENETVRPGRRTTGHGKGFDSNKGFDGKGFDGKGFDGKGFDGKGFDGRVYDMHKGDGKGDRKGRGKEDKGKGKFGDDGKGFHHPGKGDSYKGEAYKPEGHRTEDKEEDERGEALKDRYRGSRQLRWRAVNDKDIIVRVGLGTETDIVGTLMRNSLVAQVGEDKMLKNGIARMFIESIDPIPGIKGWVTRSAEAAGGPVFFKPDRGATFNVPRERGKDGKGNKGNQQCGGEKGDKGGKAMDGKGKARRPIGEGEAGTYNRPIPGP